MNHTPAQAARELLKNPDIKKKRAYSWLTLSEAPPLQWSDGEPVTDEHAQKIFGLLVKEGPDSFDPTRWTIFGALSPQTRIPWSEAIESQWLTAGGKPAHKWAVFQLAAMGASARLVTRAVELIELATHGKHKRALWYLEAMSRVDDPDIRSWIFDLSINAPYQSTLQTHALVWHNHLIAISPLERGAYMDALNLYIREDHVESHITLPDFVPDETSLELQGQTYLVTFVDDGFELGLRHADTRKITPGFPESSIHDDPTEWRVARDAFQELDAQLTPFIDSWKKAFEHAMISARPYHYSVLRDQFLSNRLMTHLIESLVWSTPEGVRVRLLEGSCFDVEYEEVRLPEETSLTLVHPLEISTDEVLQWGAQLAEDEVFPLFPQFTREFFNPSDHPFDTLESEVTGDKGGVFMDLLFAHGWRHGEVSYGTYEESYQVLPGRNARVWLMHGLMHFIDPSHAIRPGVYDVHIDDLAGRKLAPHEIDPVVYSEAYLLIERFAVAMHLL
jgi:hypothetical protein